ncbi:hypothetical protein [Haladaptatus sp. NG-WS-4]
MSTEETGDEAASTGATCPRCAETVENVIDGVRISSPDSRRPAYSWHLHTDCAADWREYVTRLRTLAGHGAFRTLVEEPLSGDVNEMVEWHDS